MRTTRILTLTLVLCVALLAGAACGGSAAGDPDQVVNAYWAALQKGDTEEARTMIAAGRESAVAGLDMDLLEDIGESSGMEQAMYDRIDISAKGFTETGETAVADVTVKMPDMADVMQTFFTEYMGELMETAFSGEYSDEEMEEMATEALLDCMDDASTVTYDETAELRQEEGVWKIYDWNFDNLEQDMADLEDDMEGWMS